MFSLPGPDFEAVKVGGGLFLGKIKVYRVEHELLPVSYFETVKI